MAYAPTFVLLIRCVNIIIPYFVVTVSVIWCTDEALKMYFKCFIKCFNASENIHQVIGLKRLILSYRLH